MRGPLRIVQVGLGALGRKLTPLLAERPQLQIVGAADIDPQLMGRDLGEVSESCRPLGVQISGSLEDAFASGTVDAAVVTTVSSLEGAMPQLRALLDCRANIVSSCEELSYPWLTAPDASAEIDGMAKAAGVSALGTGVNPGFLMDFLPITLTGICRKVTKVTVLRYQDAQYRRLPFQQKIGAGLTLEQFEERKAAGKLRHVGLTESMHMIAARMGWQLERTEDVITPIIAHTEMGSAGITVKPGMARGVQQIGSGYVGGEERIRLRFRACLCEEEVHDTVIIDGEPGIRSTIPGGVNGDIATCAILANAIPVVVAAPPGLRTMADIPPVSWFGV